MRRGKSFDRMRVPSLRLCQPATAGLPRMRNCSRWRRIGPRESRGGPCRHEWPDCLAESINLSAPLPLRKPPGPDNRRATGRTNIRAPTFFEAQSPQRAGAQRQMPRPRHGRNAHKRRRSKRLDVHGPRTATENDSRKSIRIVLIRSSASSRNRD
jgi:hypothetical protein